MFRFFFTSMVLSIFVQGNIISLGLNLHWIMMLVLIIWFHCSPALCSVALLYQLCKVCDIDTFCLFIYYIHPKYLQLSVWSFDCPLFCTNSGHFVHSVSTSSSGLAALLCKTTGLLSCYCCRVCLRSTCWWTMLDGLSERGWLTLHCRLIVSWLSWMSSHQCLSPSVSCRTW